MVMMVMVVMDCSRGSHVHDRKNVDGKGDVSREMASNGVERTKSQLHRLK